MMRREHVPLLVTIAALLALPTVVGLFGLGVTSATEIVIFAIACMALNVLVGNLNLVSFGHGAWFGLAAYVAARLQRDLMPGAFWVPLLIAVAVVAVIALGFGALILRRRGVYFALLTLALSAVLYTVAFRWTAVTGGEDGLGGIARPAFFGVDFEQASNFYVLVALIGFAIVYLLWRFHRSPIGTTLVAIRENEQRARFIGYATDSYKLLAFTVSAAITGLAGVLLLYNNRMTSAEAISVVISGEMLAMVVIGGMRSFLGPALGAAFYVLFRDELSRMTENWLLWFGLLFMAFVLFSPTGLVGVAERLLRPFRKRVEEDAAMAARAPGAVALPAFLKPEGNGATGPVLAAQGLVKHFGGIRAVQGVDLAVADRTLHALIGPNGAGKTTAFNLLSGMFAPDRGGVTLGGADVTGLAPEALTRAGIGRSFQITNLFPALSVEENVRLAVQARAPQAFNPWCPAAGLADVNAQTAAVLRVAGINGIERAEAGSLSYGGQRLLDMALALATRPRILLLDEPLAGLAAAERTRVSELIRTIAHDIPVLLVEHDVDRVFQISDTVTVMNEGSVLIEGIVEDVRTSPEVQRIYIGSGTHALAGRHRASAARPEELLALEGVNVYYGKSHILRDVSFTLHRNEVVALLGRNGAGKSTLLKGIIGIAPPARGTVTLDGTRLDGLSSAAIARRGISYVPQGRGLFAGMSVKENMELGSLRRTGREGLRWDEERIFSFFPRIRERWSSPADYLSGGEQQMVAVARALSGDTRVLLLDEPFEGLAPAVVEELFEAFDRLRQEIAIVIVDHNLDLALALSDRTVALERGAIIHDGPSAALSTDLDLRRQVLWL